MSCIWYADGSLQPIEIPADSLLMAWQAGQSHPNKLAPRTTEWWASTFLKTDRRQWIWRDGRAFFLAAPGAASAGQRLRLDENDGFPLPAGARSFANDPDGSLWLGAQTGLIHFAPPDDFSTSFPAPEVFISGFSIGQQGDRLAGTSDQMPRNEDVVAHVGSLQFDRRSAMHFRYRLSPDQQSWTESDSSELRLGRLAWGRHSLQVQADDWLRVGHASKINHSNNQGSKS